MIETKFKHTDTGVIPYDWEVKTLGEVGYLQNGFAYNSRTFGDMGYTVIRISDIKDGKIVLDDAIKSITKAPDAFIVKKGDFLIAMSGATTGKIGLYFNEFPSYINQRVGNIICVEADSGFVRYSFNSICFAEYLKTIITAGAQPNISKKQIEEFAFATPPTLAEQEKIANALSKIDQLINDLGALIEKKKAIKQGTIQELLTAKRRLKGFTGEWKSVKIGDIGNTYSGLFGKTASDFGKGEANYITFLNILCNPIIDTTIFEKVQVHPSERQNAVHKGDLFFNTSSETPEEVGICSVILDEIENLYINSFCFGFRILDETIDGKYLAYYFRCKEGRDLMTTLAQGATRYNLSKLSFSQANVTLPPTLAEQRAIANILSSMDTEITNLEQKRDKYIAIKQGMMQNLLTGKIRLI